MKITLKGTRHDLYQNTVRLNDKILDPEPSQQIYNHSPDGFQWSYEGSGPAQLALAVLLHCSNKEIALKNY